MEEALLRVEGLTKYFRTSRGISGTKSHRTEAVKGVSFSIRKGETLGVVGESGCGKSTTGKTIVGLLPPSSGSVYFEDERVDSSRGKAASKRRSQMQMIFQNPYASLDPKMTLKRILEEPLRIQGWSGEHRRRRVAQLLDYVGFDAPLLDRYPREFSGGQRQRIAIARALAVNPSFIVLDEPVSALDVSIQAQILNLLLDLQTDLSLTYLFISHDLGVVEYISDRVCVMYLGRIVEIADCRELYIMPLHPYTRLLIQSIPIPIPGDRQEPFMGEPIPSQGEDDHLGCPFCTRCSVAMSVCVENEPSLIEHRPGHFVACHRYGLTET